ncbi:MAG TPA: NAD(P)-binding domain-containing protein [Phototrophicaceae bacterium]|nr:NAD(P)-binding domain-containing protein [Phototrophicaceae bacterium]
MRVGILGSGEVGQRLGDGFMQLGYSVKIGTRNPKKEEILEWIDSHGGHEGKASSGTFAEASSFGEIVVLATSWSGASNAIRLANSVNLEGKITIDVTNPLDFSLGVPPQLALGHSDSAGETIQRLMPKSKVVKAFNTVGSPHFVHPDFPNGGPPTMFICGNDEESKKFVTYNVLGKFGWETIDIGGIEGSRLLEPLASLWITYYFRNGTGDHAFKLLQK